MGFTLIYITAVLVSIVFERQERRHRFELQLEYDRLGKAIPPVTPRLSLAVSWLNVIVGIVLFLFGIGFLFTAFDMLQMFARQAPGGGGQHIGAQFEFGAVVLATALSLIILGGMSIRQHRRFSKPAKEM